MPACPGWTVRDLIAHLLGVAEDWCHQRLEGYAGEGWTASQLERHRHRPMPELLEALLDAATAVTGLGPDPQLGEPARWAFGDALIHEADISEAVGTEQPPIDDVLTHLSAGLKRWGPQLAAGGVTLHVDVIARQWTVGAAGDDAVDLRLFGGAYEVWRGVYGRRSWSRFRALAWNRAPDAVHRVGLPYPFSFPDEPLQLGGSTR